MELQTGSQGIYAKVVVGGEQCPGSIYNNRASGETRPLIGARVSVANDKNYDYGVDKVCEGEVERGENFDSTGAGAEFVESGLIFCDFERKKGQSLFKGGGGGGLSLIARR